MTRHEIQAAVAELLSISVGRQIAHTESVTRDSEPSWDSLKHVELILLLEEHFGVQFSEEEIVALRSSDEIVHAIEAKSAA
ncbi:MAG TPA: acyl carrier protein [Candidatus Dormibacteraeota bacterium]|nr:acyl carrier protein [Candidatus Dormibacteraeota bacterium]